MNEIINITNIIPSSTVLYAGILGLMSVAVAAPAGQLRGKTNISVGDGGNPELLLAMRRHSNFIETVPLALVLMGFLEMHGVSAIAIHVFGVVLVIVRATHALTLKQDTVQNPGRFIGAAGSALLMVVMSVWAIVAFF